MKKICLILLPLSAALIGCSRIDVDPVNASAAQDRLLTEEMPYLSFDSAADLAEAIRLGEQTETKAAYYGQNRSLFTSMKESMIQNDPILSYEATRMDPQEVEPGASVYDRFGYDELVPNKAFASLLNARGEICVGDLMYKISPRGTYYFPVSKREDFERNYAKYEMTDGAETAEKTYLIDTDIYRFDTFNEDSDDSLVTVSTIDDLNTKADQGTLAGYPSYTGDASILNGKNYFYNLPNNRRLKGSIFHYDYVVFDERGAIAKCQKKAWIGWSAIKSSQKLRVTWNNVIFRCPDKKPATQVALSYFTDKVAYDHGDRVEDLFFIDGYVIPEDSYNSVVTGGQSALRSIILRDTGYDIGNYKLVYLRGIRYSLLIFAGSRYVETFNSEEADVQLVSNGMGSAGKPVGGQFFFQCLDDNGVFGAVSVITK